MWMSVNEEREKRGPSLRGSLLRIKLLEILGGYPMNTAQICRVLHGAKHAYDIKFCRPEAYAVFRDQAGYKQRGNNCLYVGCHSCVPGYGAVYRNLMRLVKTGHLETRKEFRSDPIVPNTKDLVRMWALKGKLPTLDIHFNGGQTVE